jgi:hypothetical protein
VFFPHRPWLDHAASLKADGVRALGASKHLGSLAELTFKMWGGGDAAADALVETGLLFRLARLDLSIGSLTDAGTGVLARALAARPHRLLRLDVSQKGLTGAGLALLQGVGVDIENTWQHAPDDPDYRCSAGDIE